MQVKKQYFAAAYGILLPLFAYIYCMPKNAHTLVLANQQIKILTAFDTALQTKIPILETALAEAVAAQPKYATWATKAAQFQQICTKTRKSIAEITQYKPFFGFRQNQTAAALDTIKALNEAFFNTIDLKDREYQQEKINSNTYFQLINENPSLFFLALRTHIDFLESNCLNYCAEKSSAVGNCFGPSFPFLRLAVQTENTSLHEGDRLKGWLAALTYSSANSDSCYINGNRYFIRKGLVEYKHAPQPAGKYPLVITSRKFGLRDTLYYTVR